MKCKKINYEEFLTPKELSIFNELKNYTTKIDPNLTQKNLTHLQLWLLEKAESLDEVDYKDLQCKKSLIFGTTLITYPVYCLGLSDEEDTQQILIAGLKKTLQLLHNRILQSPSCENNITYYLKLLCHSYYNGDNFSFFGGAESESFFSDLKINFSIFHLFITKNCIDLPEKDTYKEIIDIFNITSYDEMISSKHYQEKDFINFIASVFTWSEQEIHALKEDIHDLRLRDMIFNILLAKHEYGEINNSLDNSVQKSVKTNKI